MAGPANPPGASKGGFNKLFVMLPVMLAARKLDAEDPQTVQYLRIAYGSMQTLCILVVLYTFMKASSISAKDASKVVYVPAPPTVRMLPGLCGIGSYSKMARNTTRCCEIHHHRIALFTTFHFHHSFIFRLMFRDPMDYFPAFEIAWFSSGPSMNSLSLNLYKH